MTAPGPKVIVSALMVPGLMVAGLMVAGLMLSSCGVDQDAVVARSLVIPITAGDQKSINVLDEFSNRGAATLDSVEQPESNLIEITYTPDGTLTVSADEESAGAELIVGYQISLGPTADQSTLIIRVAEAEEGPAPELEIGLTADTDRMDFGQLAVGDPDRTRAMTLRNSGELDLSVSVSVSVADLPDPYGVSDSSCQLGPSEECVITVSVSGRVVGQTSAELVAVGLADDGRTDTVRVPLQADIVEATPTIVALSVDPTILDFGVIESSDGILAGPDAPERTIAVTNRGEEPLTVSLSSLRQPFAIVENGCGQLAVGASCELLVSAATSTSTPTSTSTSTSTSKSTSTPASTAAGDARAELTITGRSADDRTTEASVTAVVRIREKVQISAFTIDPQMIRLTRTATAAKVTIDNTGTLPIENLRLPDPSSLFTVDNGDCGGGFVSPFPDVLIAGDSCTFIVELTGAALQTGTVSSTKVAVTGAGLSQTLAVEIDAAGPPQISLKPTSTSFNLVDPRAIAITNSGQVPLSGLTIGAYVPITGSSGIVRLADDNCPQVLEPNDSCTIYLRFDGTTSPSTGSVAIRFGDAAAELEVREPYIR